MPGTGGVTVQCDTCGTIVSLETMMVSEKYPIDGSWIVHFKIKCPGCGTETHIAYDTPKLRAKRNQIKAIPRVDYDLIQKAADEFAVLYTSEQERARARLAEYFSQL